MSTVQDLVAAAQRHLDLARTSTDPAKEIADARELLTAAIQAAGGERS